MFKKGDTLIEVMLAVGIFSMVAVAVVAVMSNGAAGAQTALETTLAREEIDAQTEALRFIQLAYIADKDTGDDRFAQLWDAITQNALDIKNLSEDAQTEILQFSPSDCASLYSNTIKDQKAFVVNTHSLGNYTTLSKDSVNQNEINKVLISTSGQDGKFGQASTYPRLVFGTQNTNSDNSQLIDNTGYGTNLYKAEGIYIIAVKDSGITTIVTEDDSRATPQSAFYDFYVRTCWYGVGDQTPSTISTVIRLYDPKVVTTPES